MGEIIVYQPDEITRLEVHVEDETVWLTLAQMAELFDRKLFAFSKMFLPAAVLLGDA